MFTRPDGLLDADVAAVIGSSWRLPVSDVDYAPVGFGSHHWRVVADGHRWFATVDDLHTKVRAGGEPFDAAWWRLHAALSTTRCLADGGLDFVVAPAPTVGGEVLERIDQRFAIALYHHVEGTTYSFGDYPGHAERVAVLHLLARVHGATDGCRTNVVTDDFEIANRDELDAALGDLVDPWSAGPYSEPTRHLLSAHASDVVRLLGRYDRLADDQRPRTERLVITHGEPHRGNTIDTSAGVMLVDWDTCLLAPPERDLWSLVGEDPSVADAYTERTGATVDDDVLELYRLAWDLAEIAIYVSGFRRPHGETADTRTAWRGLAHHLDPARWLAR